MRKDERELSGWIQGQSMVIWWSYIRSIPIPTPKTTSTQLSPQLDTGLHLELKRKKGTTKQKVEQKKLLTWWKFQQQMGGEYTNVSRIKKKKRRYWEKKIFQLADGIVPDWDIKDTSTCTVFGFKNDANLVCSSNKRQATTKWWGQAAWAMNEMEIKEKILFETQTLFEWVIAGCTCVQVMVFLHPWRFNTFLQLLI